MEDLKLTSITREGNYFIARIDMQNESTLASWWSKCRTYCEAWQWLDQISKRPLNTLCGVRPGGVDIGRETDD